MQKNANRSDRHLAGDGHFFPETPIKIKKKTWFYDFIFVFSLDFMTIAIVCSLNSEQNFTQEKNMASISDFRRGMAIMYNNDIYLITEFLHVTQSRGRAMIKTKLKNVKTGRVIDNTFRMTDKIESVRLDEKEMQYLYAQDGMYYFMDIESYEQIPFTFEQLGEDKNFIKENMIIKILYYICSFGM